MQIALITADFGFTDPSCKRGGAPLIAGRTLLHHQLMLALDAGCERVICFAERQPDDMEALSRTCSDAGVPLRLIHRPQEMSALVAATDSLLVIARNILTEADILMSDAARSFFILALPAEPAIAAGFERIDAKRAWAGAMLIPGHQVEQLHQLPHDIDPGSALLRIALMNGTQIAELSNGLLSDNRISLPHTSNDFRRIESAWMNRLAAPIGFAAPARALVERLALRAAPRLLASSSGIAGTTAVLGLLLLACVAAFSGSSGLALAAMVLAYAGITVICTLHRFRCVGERSRRRARSGRVIIIMEALADLVLIYILAAVAPLAIGVLANWFAPIMMIGLLRLAGDILPANLALPLSDRMCLTILLLVAYLASVIEVFTMIGALALVALLFAYGTRATDITTS